MKPLPERRTVVTSSGEGTSSRRDGSGSERRGIDVDNTRFMNSPLVRDRTVARMVMGTVRSILVVLEFGLSCLSCRSFRFMATQDVH